MISTIISILNQEGLHLRPAGILSQTAARYHCHVTIRYENETVNAKSILSVMSAGIPSGRKIRLICDGIDEKEAMEGLTAIIQSGLGEKIT